MKAQVHVPMVCRELLLYILFGSHQPYVILVHFDFRTYNNMFTANTIHHQIVFGNNAGGFNASDDFYAHILRLCFTCRWAADCSSDEYRGESFALWSPH